MQADQELDKSALRAGVKRPSADRPTFLYKALDAGMTAEEISRQSGIDLWFTTQLAELHAIGQFLRGTNLNSIDDESFRQAKEVLPTVWYWRFKRCRS